MSSLSLLRRAAAFDPRQDLGIFSEEELQQLLRLRLDALELEATAEKAAEAAEAKA